MQWADGLAGAAQLQWGAGDLPLGDEWAHAPCRAASGALAAGAQAPTAAQG